MELGSLEWGGGGGVGEECVLTELNQLVISTGGGRVGDLHVGCRISLSLGWDVDFGYRRSFSP